MTRRTVTEFRAISRRGSFIRLPRLEFLEARIALSADTAWTAIGDLDLASESEEPIAEPAVLVPAPNSDAASLLAVGGPGDPTLPGFGNVARSGNNGTVVYLGAGWAITANHVSLTSTINFGGTLFSVDTSTVTRLRNADNSFTDLKMFRLTEEPPLPPLYSSYIATAPPSGQVFMIGNGMTQTEQLFWSVNKTQSPWVWTQIAEPNNPNNNQYGGVAYASPRVVRWGENTVKETGLSVQVGNSTVSAFTTQFDYQSFTNQPPLPFETQASPGDSGGAVFSYVDGKWVLSGIMVAVSAPFSGQPNNTALYGSITLMADLSVYRDQILSIIGVVDRHVFYNQSSFDGNDASINAADDLAIATDKSAYLAGSGPATFDNITSYVRGINGIMIDVAPSTGAITADDFEFRVGTNNSPTTWPLAPEPDQISVRVGAGVGGADRIVITWPSGSITNTWLQVVLKGDDAAGGFNTNTGLRTSDQFFFGNRVGDAGGNPDGIALTNVQDEILVQNNLGFDHPVTDPHDFDRNGLVNTADRIIARTSPGFLVMIQIEPEGVALFAAEPNVAVESDPFVSDRFRVPLWQNTLDDDDRVPLPKRVIEALADDRWGPFGSLRPRVLLQSHYLPTRMSLRVR